MGYGSVGGAYGGGYCENVGGYGRGYRKCNNMEFVLLVVLFILLIIVGANFIKGY